MYQKKQRKTIDVTTPNQENVINVGEINHSQESSRHSIYDELELYEFARSADTNPTSPYTVLTRDPYGYDELYGLQRRIAILTGNPDETSEELTKLSSVLKAASLPTNLNAMADDVNDTVEEEEYIDMLPEKLELQANGAKSVDGCMERSKSLNDVVMSVKGIKTKEKEMSLAKNVTAIGKTANFVSVKVENH